MPDQLSPHLPVISPQVTHNALPKKESRQEGWKSQEITHVNTGCEIQISRVTKELLWKQWYSHHGELLKSQPISSAKVNSLMWMKTSFPPQWWCPRGCESGKGTNKNRKKQKQTATTTKTSNKQIHHRTLRCFMKLKAGRRNVAGWYEPRRGSDNWPGDVFCVPKITEQKQQCHSNRTSDILNTDFSAVWFIMHELSTLLLFSFPRCSDQREIFISFAICFYFYKMGSYCVALLFVW